MINFITLPKKGEQRSIAIQHVAQMFVGMVSTGQGFDGEPADKSVHAFMKKSLKRDEFPYFLALVYSEDDTLPTEFDAYEILTMESVIDYASSGRVLELNDLLAQESDYDLASLCVACGILKSPNKFEMSRSKMVVELYRRLSEFETLFPCTNALFDHFQSRYSFDYHTASVRWSKFFAKYNPVRIVEDSQEAGVLPVLKAIENWSDDAANFFTREFLNESDCVGRRRKTVAEILARLGPQEILRLLYSQFLLSQRTYEKLNTFTELDFSQTLDYIISEWRSWYEGEDQIALDDDSLDREVRNKLNAFIRQYFAEDDLDDEDEYDEEEEEEDFQPIRVQRKEKPTNDIDDDEEEDDDIDEEEDDEDKPVATFKQLVHMLEITQASKDEGETCENPEFFLEAKHEDIQKSIEYVYAEYPGVMNQLSHASYYEVYSIFADLTGIPENNGLNIPAIITYAFQEYLQHIKEHQAKDLSKLVMHGFMPSLNSHEFSHDERIEQIEEYFESIDSVSNLYKAVKLISDAAEVEELAIFSIDPVSTVPVGHEFKHDAEIQELIDFGTEHKIVTLREAQSLSRSELKARIAEHLAMQDHEALPEAGSPNVTQDNYLEVIPELTRQQLIAELAKRGYSDNSLRKIGAPKLREIFIGALNRMYK